MRLVIMFLLYSISFGKTWIVDDNGDADFNNIQDAIYAASDGDTIFVKNGAYNAFGVPSIDITILGESNQDTKIDNLGNINAFISTTKKCQISNLRFTNNLRAGIYVTSYSNYSLLKTIPELIIDNCIFDFDSSDYYKGPGIQIDIDYYEFINTFKGSSDSLANAFKIYNKTFVKRFEAIVFAVGGVVGKKNRTVLNELPILNVDGEHNYFGVSDSVEIQELIIDINNKNPPEEYYSNSDTNYTRFDFIPYCDSLITSYYTISKGGIKYNNFINCTYVFASGLIYPNTVNVDEFNKNFPKVFYISQSYPNPFNQTTNIQLVAAQPMEITIKIYSPIGEEIKELSTMKMIEVGISTETINFGNRPSGIYFINVSNREYNQTIKVVLLK